ncbi:MAG: SIMPL domain-containing protein [Planctomycetes bacterium]|nr:SIMPL domain-containing protein [Planctomycetota bacterium]
MKSTFLSRFPPLVKNFGLGMFLLGATLALGVVLSSQAVGQAIASHSKSGRTIHVKGVAEVMMLSDKGNWRGSVCAKGAAPAECFAKLDASMNKVQSLIRTNQFPTEEISLDELTLTTVYVKNDKGVALSAVDHYVASQEISVASTRVEALRDLQRKAADLQKDGVTITSYDPSYTCSTIDSVKMDLLEKATQNGYDRAMVLAKGSGSKVGTLANASQGVFQIVPYGSNEVSDYGLNDTSSIKKSAKAVVSMEYFIER